MGSAWVDPAIIQLLLNNNKNKRNTRVEKVMMKWAYSNGAGGSRNWYNTLENESAEFVPF